jgi:tetratricopeptide (TPR) repeat protein
MKVSRHNAAQAPPRKKMGSTKKAKAPHGAKTAGAKSAGRSKGRKILTQAAIETSKANLPMKSKKQATKHVNSLGSAETATRAAASARRADLSRPTPPAEALPSLLAGSRVTSEALTILERGIKLIFQRELKKARVEFESILDKYPAEQEIRASARSYIQICDRGEAQHKKPAATNDQLYALGVLDHNRGNYEAAVSYFQRSLEQHPDAEYIHYSLAASLAMKGDGPEAIRVLRKAIELNEDNRVYAKNDSDFHSLHDSREFSDLVGMAQGGAGAPLP